MILKSKISPLQFSALLGLSSIGMMLLIQDTFSCFSMIISVVVAFLLTIPTLAVMYKNNRKIPVFGRIITVVFAILITVKTLNSFTEFFTSLVEPSNRKAFVALTVIVALIYPAVKGIEAISRGAIIGGAFAVLAVCLILVFLPYGDMSFFSVNDSSFSAKDSLNTLFIFSPMILSLWFSNNFDKYKVRSVVWPFLITSLILAVVMCFSKLLNIGEYPYPFYTIAKVSCKSIPMGFSGIYIAFSIVCMFFAILYFTLTVKSACKTSAKPLPIIFLTICFGLSILTMYLPTARNIILNNYLILGLYVAITLITPIIIAVKERKNG